MTSSLEKKERRRSGQGRAGKRVDTIEGSREEMRIEVKKWFPFITPVSSAKVA